MLFYLDFFLKKIFFDSIKLNIKISIQIDLIAYKIITGKKTSIDDILSTKFMNKRYHGLTRLD